MTHHARPAFPSRVLPVLRLVLFCLVAASLMPAQPAKPDRRSGIYRGQPVTFEVIDGWAVVEGDIILGRPEDLAPPAGGKNGPRNSLSVIPTPDRLWPLVGAIYQVPYTNDNKNAAVEAAVTQFNATFPNVIQYVPRTQEADYVQFQITENGQPACASSSFIGRIGRNQPIRGQGGFNVCVPVLMHEMGHSVGLYHEQERSDRDSFVQIQYGNLDPSARPDYDRILNSLDLGLYDLGSTMHYGAITLATDPTDAVMVSIPVGIPFKEGGGYSAGDIDGILRLYGAAPATVTITTNPVGLQVSVDGQAVTSGTPGATFAWDLQSAHTLDVPDNLQTQTLNGTTYVFGRWNDVTPDQPVNHQITIDPGDGSALYPAAVPKITVYAANFRQLVPAAGTIVTRVSPAGSGQVAVGTDPMSDVGGTPLAAPSYYLLQPVPLQANPAAGFNFYDWQVDNRTSLLSGTNPLTVRPALQIFGNTGGAVPRNVTARFAKSPVTTIATDPPGLTMTVDGQKLTSPRNFAQDYDASWTLNSRHTIAVTSPLDSNTADRDARLVFSSWSDSSTQTHDITAGAANAAYTASFGYQFPLKLTSPGLRDTGARPCSAGTITAAPAAADTYYDSGTQVSLAVQPNAGWTFVGWQGDLTGNAATSTLTMDRTRSVQAIFNINADPLAITGLAPASAPVGGDAFQLTINGSGFGNTTSYCFFPPGVNFVLCNLVTFVSSSQVMVPVSKDLLGQAQSVTLTLFNSPDNQCLVSASTALVVK